MKLSIPELSLVLLIGPSGCGKSTFARRHFRTTEIISSDFFRGLVCDDEANQSASRDAFDLVYQLVARRLHWRRFTVVDATNVQSDARKPLLELARRYHYLTSAIVFDIGEERCQQNNRARPGRTVPGQVITGHYQHLRNALPLLQREGYERIYHLRQPEQIAEVTIERVPLRIDRRHEKGPFDLIGDVHGCIDELLALLAGLGYRIGHQTDPQGSRLVALPPPGRKAIFVGDLGDRGPDTPGVYRLVMDMVRAGQALCVMGNHDNKLLRKLRGNQVQMTHGLAESMEQLSRQPESFRQELRRFLEEQMPTHYLLDGGRLVVAHAGLREDLQGRVSARVRSFALFGDTTGEMDELGLPIRRNWAAEYKGKGLVVYGHTPVREPRWENHTVNLDTGCVFGGRLTALRYPEREIVSVAARQTYYEPIRGFLDAMPPEGPEEEGAGSDLSEAREGT